MKFPSDYPYSPPSIRFLTKVWHPNVYEVNSNVLRYFQNIDFNYMIWTNFTRTAIYAYRFYIRQSTIRKAENCRVNDGIPLRTYAPSCYPLYLCSTSPTHIPRPMSMLPSCIEDGAIPMARTMSIPILFGTWCLSCLCLWLWSRKKTNTFPCFIGNKHWLPKSKLKRKVLWCRWRSRTIALSPRQNPAVRIHR